VGKRPRPSNVLCMLLLYEGHLKRATTGQAKRIRTRLRNILKPSWPISRVSVELKTNDIDPDDGDRGHL
jgi:hypothetical protein